MAQPEVIKHVHTWIEIGFAIVGFGGVILSQWRATIGVRNEVLAVKKEIKRLADEASKANARVRSLEIKCAKQHGFTTGEEFNDAG